MPSSSHPCTCLLLSSRESCCALRGSLPQRHKGKEKLSGDLSPRNEDSNPHDRVKSHKHPKRCPVQSRCLLTSEQQI